MKNSDISKILRQANNNNIYLWDLPRPKWKQEDFDVLDAIKNGAKYKTKKILIDDLGLSDKSLKMQQEQSHRMKPIRRKSDGKVFSGMIQLCRETGLNRSSISLALNGRPNAVQKYIDEYEFINK
jgi:hypothetical protein